MGVVYEISPMEIQAYGVSEEEPSYDVDCIYFSSENQQSAILGSDIILDASQTYTEELLWVVNAATIEDFTVNIYYTGEVTVAIQSISLVESLAYRMVRCLLWVVFFVLIDIFYLCFFKRGIDVADKKRSALFVAMLVFACYPLISNMNFLGMTIPST